MSHKTPTYPADRKHARIGGYHRAPAPDPDAEQTTGADDRTWAEVRAAIVAAYGVGKRDTATYAYLGPSHHIFGGSKI
jgi:hypothetical protein